MPLYRDFKDPDTALEPLQLKLQQREHAEDDARIRALEILARKDDSEPRLVAEHELGALPDAARERIERAKDIHLGVFHRTHPLLPDETLINEACAVLAEDWGAYPKGSVAVVRETSICREIHVFPYLRLVGTDIQAGAPNETMPTPAVAVEPVLPEMVGFDVTSIAGDLYLGLLKGLLNKATTALFEYLFPPGPPAWMDQVYTQMRNIVHSEIEQARLLEMRGDLQACAIHVHDYNAFHIERPARAVEYLEKAYDICVRVTAQLEEMGDPAAMIYCVSVGQWFLIMQELARIDPDHLDNPLDSKWADLIQKRAPRTAEHAEKLRKSIIARRLECISEPREFRDVHSDRIFYFTDSETKYVWKKVQGCTSREARECGAAREAYYRRIEAEITDKVKDIATSVAAWSELARYPLPQPEPALVG